LLDGYDEEHQFIPKVRQNIGFKNASSITTQLPRCV